MISSFGQLEAARAQIIAAQAQVDASETALNGVREEARVGQRTTLDVLNAQQELLNARVNLITAQRDRVVASYAVVQAMGRLNSRALGLAVNHYSPRIHLRSGQGPVGRPDRLPTAAEKIRGGELTSPPGSACFSSLA